LDLCENRQLVNEFEMNAELAPNFRTLHLAPDALKIDPALEEFYTSQRFFCLDGEAAEFAVLTNFLFA